MRLLIFGYGGMGKLFRDFFESRGYRVFSYDVDPKKREVDLSEIENFDVIFLCVPMDNIGEAVNEIAKRTKKPLVVDISAIFLS